jgi:xanthine dehydrogenase accessory factor
MAGQAPVEVLAMPVVPRPLLVIVGGGHVGQAIAAQAALVGFDLLVVEDREGFAHPALFPSGTSIRFGRPAAELGALTLDSTTYVVLVSRNHLTDAEALAVCLRRPAAYLGMIGSRRKIRMLRESWIASGRATVADFDRLYAPIGLDLGALTVPEIACSVVAQLVAVRRKGKAPRLI